MTTFVKVENRDAQNIDNGGTQNSAQKGHREEITVFEIHFHFCHTRK